MTYCYTRFLSRLSTTILNTHCRKFSLIFHGIKHHLPSSSTIISHRCYCEKPQDLYAAINEDDLEIYEQISNYKDVDFESIAEGDPKMIKMLKQIQLEIDIYAQEGGAVPNEILASQWVELLSFSSKSQRMKYIRYLWRKEKQKLAKQQKQLLYRKEFEEFKNKKEYRGSLSTNSPMEYGLLRTTLFNRIYDQTMKNLYNFRLFQATMFGPHLIIDCSYEDFMNPIEISGCVKDLVNSWSLNRDHFYPFDLIFCNLHRNSKLFSRLNGFLPGLADDPLCSFNYTDKHYLDLFPKEKLIYLTPHCNEEMTHYEGDCTYIIGGVNDKSNDMALSLAKAKKEGLRRAKFPIDKHMVWYCGKKSLSIPQCVSIMNDLKDGCSWKFAFRNLIERQQQRVGDLSSKEDQERKTNVKTAEHIEELLRLRNVYDMLLIKKDKQN